MMPMIFSILLHCCYLSSNLLDIILDVVIHTCIYILTKKFLILEGLIVHILPLNTGYGATSKVKIGCVYFWEVLEQFLIA